jgi:hypothetical protein
MLVWVAVSLVGLGAGAAVQDRWPRSITARIAAMFGAAWFGGVWLSLYLLGTP